MVRPEHKVLRLVEESYTTQKQNITPLTMKKKMKQIDKTFYSLCEEIDDLKEAVEYWKTMYETERATNNKMLNDNLETAKQGVANALRFALSVSDDENGNLVISKENRKDLAENWIGSGQ